MIRLFSVGTDCKQSPSTGATVSMLDAKRPSKRKQQRHVAMTRDTSKLVVGKSERQEKKARNYC